MDLFGVQMPVANQFAREQQHRDLVAVARLQARISVHVEQIQRNTLGHGKCGELCLHFLAQCALAARIQQEPVRRPFQREGKSLPL